MRAEQAKIANIIDMAIGFSAMTRVFKKDSTTEIRDRLQSTLPQISSSKSEQVFRKFHSKFCLWFAQNIKTAERNKDGVTIKRSSLASYGQGAKVLDVALKVYVYYCRLPDPNTADQTTRWLNSAVDTKMLKYLKNRVRGTEDSFRAASIEEVDASTYTKLQALLRKDIERNFPSGTLPVQWDDIMWRKLNKRVDIHP